MKYRGEATLKNGETLLLRSLCRQDAGDMLDACRKASNETMNLSRYADEWTASDEQEGEQLCRMENAPKALMLGAFYAGKLVGVASLTPCAGVDRARHRANVGVLVRKRCWNLGIGTAMMRVLIEQAKTTALEQLELEVVDTNETAIRLYERLGFEAFARHPRKFRHRDGSYADVLLMMLELRRSS